MGCCNSADADIPKSVTTEVYGEQRTNMPVKVYFPYVEVPVTANEGPNIDNPKAPPMPSPTSGGAHQPQWCALELGYQWAPKGSVKVSMGDKPWSKKVAQWFNGALLGPGSLKFVCGREHVLFAGMQLKGEEGCVVLSTGRLLVLSKKKPFIKAAYHVFDLRMIKATSAGNAYKVSLDFGDLFPDGPQPAAQGHLSKVDVTLELLKRQAADLVAVLKKLGLVLLSTPVQAEVPPELNDRVTLPQPPCDGGFLSVFHATCAYFLVPLLSLKLGVRFFSAVPLLELDITGFDPLSAQVAAAIRAGVQRSSSLRGFVRQGKPISPDAWEQLVPMFKQGTMLKVHVPDCGLNTMQTEQFVKGLVNGNANYVVDLNLSGNFFSQAGADALANAIAATQGSMRVVSLARCGIPREGVQKLIAALSQKCSKIRVLSLSGNEIGALPQPEQLAIVFKSPQLEVLELGGTGVQLEKIIADVEDKQVQSLRELDVSNLAFPPDSLAKKFFGFFGANLERISMAGFARTPQQVALLLNALAARPSPNLEMDFSAVSAAEAVGGLALAIHGGNIPKAGVALGSAPSASESCQLFNTMEPQIVGLYVQATRQGLKGGEAHQQVHQAVLELVKSKCAPHGDLWNQLGEALAGLTSTRLRIAPQVGTGTLGQALLSIVAGEEAIGKVGVNLTAIGSGPPLAMLMAGLGNNKHILELDVRNGTGGDAVASTLGAALKLNRTLRSVKAEGNYFSNNGLSAIRGALYGNKKLVEFPFPEADCNCIISGYQAKMKELEQKVLDFRAGIKRAFKSTKGARTPYVVNTLNTNVQHITNAKIAMARARGTVEKYGKVQQEIQEAIHRNQTDSKNLEADKKQREKQNVAAWAAAGKALDSVKKLQEEKKKVQGTQDFAMWTERQKIGKMWIDKCAELRKKKKDVEWLERWMKENTKEGQSLVATGRACEGLVRRVPAQLANDVKNEVKKTKEFIKSEEILHAGQQSFNSKIQEQQLQVARLQASPNWVPPPANGVPGLSAGQAKVLQGQVQPRAAQPPPMVMQGRIVGVATPQGAYAAGESPIVGQVVGVVPPTPAGHQTQYEQFQVYQQQQMLQHQMLQQKVAAQPGGVPAYAAPYYPRPTYGQPGYTPCLPPQPHTTKKDDTWKYAAAAGLGGLGVGMLGMFMYNHYQHHWYNHYGGYDGGLSHHGYYDYDDSWDNNQCDWANEYDQGEEPAVWDTSLEGDTPEGFNTGEVGDTAAPEADAGAVEEAGEAVGMYAGGEDDRPGRGPRGGSGRHAAKALLASVEPARLDIAEWFKERIQGAEKAAREVVLGRVGPLPCHKEVFVRTASSAAEPGSPTPGICLVTQCSLDRLGRLEEQLKTWEGEVSAAVYVEAAPGSVAAAQARQAVLETCARAAAARAEVTAAPPLWTIVALFQLDDKEVRCPAYDRLYPVNTLRNAALAAARAALVFLLDVDFVPSAGLYSLLCGKDCGQRLQKALGSSPHSAPMALVVPAFEATRAAESGEGEALPRAGIALREAYAAGEVEGFHVGHFPRGHRATDFPRWLAGPCAGTPPKLGRLVEAVHGVDAYPVEYEEHFEPYIVAERSLVPAYDERFRGYGLNKISHLYQVHRTGFTFCTIDHGDAFVVAAKHPKSKSWKVCVGPVAEAEQRARIATHYATFKEELRTKHVARPSRVPRQLSRPEGLRPAPVVPPLVLQPTLCAHSAKDLAELLLSEGRAFACAVAA